MTAAPEVVAEAEEPANVATEAAATEVDAEAPATEAAAAEA
jgi:hypothetical protein